MTSERPGRAELLPRRLLFGNPERAQVTVSPDGAHLAWLAPVDGLLEVWVAPVGDPAAARPVTSDRRRGVRAYAWARSGVHLLYPQDEGGDEDWHVYAADLAGGGTRDLTPFRGVQAQIVAGSPTRPHEIVLGINDRDPRWHDLYVVDVRTGERTLLLTNDRFVGFDLDGDFRIRFATEPTPDGGARILRRTDDGGWSPFADLPAGEEMNTDVRGVTSDGSTAYLMDARGRDTAAFVEVDVASGRSRLLAEDPSADAGEMIRDPVTRRVEAVSFEHLRRRWTPFTPAAAADLKALEAACEGDSSVTSATSDGRWWSVATDPGNGPSRYHLYDRETRKARFLFTARPELERARLAGKRGVLIRARDGLELPSYLSLPPGRDEGGRPPSPLPMVLQVHGGPWARDGWQTDPAHLWLADRGYAVLSVNFRGSTGFGKAFVNAGDHEWYGRMHDDLVDAVEWAVAEGIADRARVAVAGGSYGGYAALVGLARTPELFACGVDVVGPSNLVTLIESIPPYWAPMLEQFTRRVGDPRTPEGRADLLARSPLSHVASIRRPLLIAQGANDPRVKRAESDQVVAALKAHGIPVTYVLFPDEGHGFARPPNALAFRAVQEAFLAEHVGGRCEPVGDAFEGSSIEFVEGRRPA